ncbi:MAG: DUF1254 domain-containing protein [Rhodopseudomonas sp.]|uniref:DUF1214 domain-containing protein n=1 Tax=Rhodopseudomonas sp. TaxID=1078 RepID=UPI0018284C29|nr:DUF1214 domain-containing protein [Rhodopseudomonas sp.]NVN84590.1 DUF1254 domain-containing protein [Rhodopseudomonas sp.]
MRYIFPVLFAVILVFGANFAVAAETVTVDNFVRAETDLTMKRYVAQGGLGRFVHIRQPTPIEKQDVIRMNRDTLYSLGVFDLTQPVTIEKPASGGRFQSMMIVNEDHSISPVIYNAGKYRLTQKEIGTRYVVVVFRTFMDPANADDVKAANALQDRIVVTQSGAGSFEIPDWDEASLKKVRDAVNVLAATKKDTSRMFGEKSKLNPIDHLLGAAYGWGGNPKTAAIYVNAVPAENDGKTPYALTVKDVPVDGFWSVTVYNAEGFMQKNDRDAYSFNNVTAKKDQDGSITIHFGGDPGSSNYLPITDGWNYIVRLYQPRKVLVDGKWKFPDAKPVK